MKRFKKSVMDFAKNNPKLRENLVEFLAFKVDHPTRQFGKRDTFFTGGRLKGLRHYHLVGGNIILIYDIDGSDLRLLEVGVHDDYVGGSGRAQNLASHISAVTRSDLSPFDDGAAEKATFSPQEIKLIRDTLFHFAASDPQDVRDYIAGKDDIIGQLAADVAQVPHEELLARFQDLGGFIPFLKSILKDMGQSYK